MKNYWGDEIPERTKLDLFLIKYDRKITGLACVLGFIIGTYIGRVLLA